MCCCETLRERYILTRCLHAQRDALPGSLVGAACWLLSTLTRLHLSRLSAATLIPAHFATFSLRLSCRPATCAAPQRGSTTKFFRFFLSARNGASHQIYIAMRLYIKCTSKRPTIEVHQRSR